MILFKGNSPWNEIFNDSNIINELKQAQLRLVRHLTVGFSNYLYLPVVSRSVVCWWLVGRLFASG